TLGGRWGRHVAERWSETGGLPSRAAAVRRGRGPRRRLGHAFHRAVARDAGVEPVVDGADVARPRGPVEAVGAGLVDAAGGDLRAAVLGGAGSAVRVAE